MAKTWITHPETGGVQLVTDEAQAEVWGPRDWIPVVVDYAAASAAVGAPVVRPEQLTPAYVRERATEQLAAATEAEHAPAPEPVETTTSVRRAGRKTGEETA
ncbi:hypothetical protein MXD62_19420 [Frankia sp. Mgl5]|uniref:hypothetical protein n=1 Tax=Frankia sp. Mgl5 TaxID=2933793 RepID=UPI00200E77B9|nr:hypothetical protein [Frankia sp. Mgl5]MCK9929322.1 hypothetical protein [Frankia sp. Mgl5]